MKTTTAATKAAWLSGDYAGTQAPMQRATIQNMNVLLRTSPDGDKYASMIFGQPATPVELPNVKSINWDRSVDADAATCTIVLYNTEPLPLGTVPERSYELGIEGFYTFNRGVNSWSTSRWGHTKNAWQDRIVPDRMIRTYEGYGYDPTKTPEADPAMYSSGVWIVDDVAYGTDGLITVTCRDGVKLLIEQIAFPPVVPLFRYPLKFERYRQIKNPDTYTSVAGRVRPAFDISSNQPYTGTSPLYGHAVTDPYDTSDSTYWLSTGNARPNAPYSFEYTQGKFASGTLAAVHFKVWGGAYKAYISVFADGVWKGNQVIPYDPNNPASAPNGSDIKFVASMSVGRDGVVDWLAPVPYPNATKVRVSFTELFNSGLGQFPYRAGVRSVEVTVGVPVAVDGGYRTEGDYGDYTEIVKRLLAYGGFWWPKEAADAYLTTTGGTVVTQAPTTDDPYLKVGRIWGDLEMSGTNGPNPLGVPIWDKKPLMDCINYIKEILGFNFFVDERGGAIFRSPNIWSVGNYFTDGGGANAGRTTETVIIDERATLMALTATLSSRSVRERVFIANVNGRIGATSAGYNPYPAGLRRVGGWSDQNFKTEKECQVMADLITLRQLFTYRTDTVTIPGNPAIQIDDQVQLVESTTEEGYLHYVKGISSSWDLESRRWIYQLDTHWLGERAFDRWVFDPSTLSLDTQTFLRTLGKIS